MLNILINDSLLADDIRLLLATLNIGIYAFIAKMYNLIMDLANVCVFSADLISDMAIKVYTLIGVVMLFSLSIALIQYLIDPEKISDKQMGGSAIVKRIFIAIILIIIMPSFFSLLYRTQSALITDRVVENLVLGTTDENEYKAEYSIDSACYNSTKVAVPEIVNIGDYIALNVFAPFYQITNEDTPEKKEARKGFINDDSAFVDYCEATSVTSLLSDSDILIDPTMGGGDAISSGEYRIDFNGLMALLVGIGVLALFVVTAMDIATRSIKLGFLQLVAPVPILGYISPSKKQSDMLGKWFHEVVLTWGDLFIRLIGLNLVVLILSEISKSSLSIGINPAYVRQSDGTLLLNLFVIIGGLIFAKKLPSIIEQIFGFKFSGGSFSLNPLKKIENDAMFGKQVTGVTRAVPKAIGAGLLGAGGFVYGNVMKNKDLNKKNEDKLSAIKTMNKSKNDLKLFNKSKLSNADNQKKILERNKDKYLKNHSQSQYDNKIKKFNSQSKYFEKNKNILQNDLKSNEKKAEVATSKYNGTKEKFDSQFSFKHPIRGGIMKGLRSTAEGAKLGYNSKSIFSKPIQDPIDAAKKAADTQRNNDKFNIKERILNKITDVAGYENESGTSSMIEGDIKKANNELRNIQNAIETTSNKLSRYPDATEYDSAGNISLVSSYMADDANQRQFINSLIAQYKDLREAEENKKKEIKKLESFKREKKK